MTPRRRKKGYTSAEYSRLDAVNWSTLKAMRDSPLHYAEGLKRPAADTASMAVGRATHALTFEPKTFYSEFAIWRGERRAGEEWARFQLENPGKTILREEDARRAGEIAKAVRAYAPVAALLEKGEAEKVVTWQDPNTGLWCKSRLDWLGSSILDLKTSQDISPRAFSASAYRYGYCHQLAMYRWGVEVSTGITDLPCYIVAVESDEPHDVALYRLNDADLSFALDEVQELLAKVFECRARGAWPGRFLAETELTMPRWAWQDENGPAELGITLNGKAD